MATRASIIRRAMDLVPERALATRDGVTALTATGGDSNTLIDTNGALMYGASVQLYKNWFIWRPDKTDSDQVKIITSFTPASQAYEISTNTWSDPPASPDPYRVCKDHPFLWLRAYAEAMREDCFFIRRDNFSPVSAQRRLYQVDAAPISVSDMARQADILDIEWHAETDASNEEQWQPWGDGRRAWETYDDAGTVFIVFTGILPDTTIQMRLVGSHPYTVLTDETTVSAVDEMWAALAVVINMWRLAGSPESPADDWSRAIRRLDALNYMRKRRRQELGIYAFRRIVLSNRQVAHVGVGGRAGRGIRW